MQIHWGWWLIPMFYRVFGGVGLCEPSNAPMNSWIKARLGRGSWNSCTVDKFPMGIHPWTMEYNWGYTPHLYDGIFRIQLYQLDNSFPMGIHRVQVHPWSLTAKAPESHGGKGDDPASYCGPVTFQTLTKPPIFTTTWAWNAECIIFC